MKSVMKVCDVDEPVQVQSDNSTIMNEDGLLEGSILTDKYAI